MILNDKEIKRLVDKYSMITPFDETLIRTAEQGHKIISAGLSSFGYDLRTAREFKVFIGPMANDSYQDRLVDPKNMQDRFWHSVSIRDDGNGEYVVIPPLTFALCHSVETINLPNNITALVTMKSTYARSGLICYTTVGEAGWKGQYVIEILNALSAPVKVYVNEGIAQLLFLQGNASAEVSYGNRAGKYQDQVGITHAKV